MPSCPTGEQLNDYSTYHETNPPPPLTKAVLNHASDTANKLHSLLMCVQALCARTGSKPTSGVCAAHPASPFLLSVEVLSRPLCTELVPGSGGHSMTA